MVIPEIQLLCQAIKEDEVVDEISAVITRSSLLAHIGDFIAIENPDKTVILSFQ